MKQSNSSTKVFTFLLNDGTGVIKVPVWGIDVDKFKHLVDKDMVEVTKFRVMNNNQLFSQGADFDLKILQDTIIEKVPDDGTMESLVLLKSYTRIIYVMGQLPGRLHHVNGIVTSIEPTLESSNGTLRTNVTITDECGNYLQFTVWGIISVYPEIGDNVQATGSMKKFRDEPFFSVSAESFESYIPPTINIRHDLRPISQPSTPEKAPSTPDKCPSTPEKSPSTPEKASSTPEKAPSTPEKAPSTPQPLSIVTSPKINLINSSYLSSTTTELTLLLSTPISTNHDYGNN